MNWLSYSLLAIGQYIILPACPIDHFASQLAICPFINLPAFWPLTHTLFLACSLAISHTIILSACLAIGLSFCLSLFSQNLVSTSLNTGFEEMNSDLL